MKSQLNQIVNQFYKGGYAISTTGQLMKKHNLDEIDRLLASDLASQVSPKS